MSTGPFRIVLVGDGPIPHPYMNYRGDALLAHWRHQQDLHVCVVAPRAAGCEDVRSGERVTVEPLGDYRRTTSAQGMASRVTQMVRAYLVLRRAFRDPSTGMVRTISTLPTAVAVLARGRRTHVPIVANLSDFYEDLYVGSRLPLPRLLTRLFRGIDRLCRRADLVIVDTSCQRDMWRRRGVPRERCVVLPHGLPRSGRALGSARSGSPGVDVTPRDRLLGVYVGDIGEMDGLDLLIEALALLRRRGLPLSLCVVGSGQASVMSGLKQLAVHLRVESSIAWVDHIPNRALPSLFGQADVCYAPFRLWRTSSTSIPNKVLEYLTSASPIVAPHGSALRVALGDALDYFTPGDAASLAEVSFQLLTRTPRLQPPQREARRRLQELLSWDRVAHHETGVVRAVLAGRVQDWSTYDYELRDGTIAGHPQDVSGHLHASA